MMDETMDAVNDDEELEQEADEEVDKVLYELTDGKLGQAGRVGGELPVRPFPFLDLRVDIDIWFERVVVSYVALISRF